MDYSRSHCQKGTAQTLPVKGESQAAPEGLGTEESASPPAAADSKHQANVHSRRSVLTGGAKLVFVAPVISTFFAHQAYATNYSCYGVGHKCLNPGPNWEPCCSPLTCQVDGGSPTGFSCQ